MQGLKRWAVLNKDKVQKTLNLNKAYVFFRIVKSDADGPLGALNVPLTAGRSLAVDREVLPLGYPVYLSTTHPNSSQKINKLMFAQDTGGAIKGPIRGDYFWGFGEEAGKLAGKMKQKGRMWLIQPR